MLDTNAIEAYTENDNLLAWAPNGEENWILESTLRKGAGYSKNSLDRLIELNPSIFEGNVEVVTGEALKDLKLNPKLQIEKHAPHARFLSRRACIFAMVVLGTTRKAKVWKIWALNVIDEVMSKGFYIDPALPANALHGLLIAQSKQMQHQDRQIQQVLNGLQQQQESNNYVTTQLVEAGHKSLTRFGQDFSQSLSECRTLTSQNAEKTLKLQRQARDIEGHEEEKRVLRVECSNAINKIKLELKDVKKERNMLDFKYTRARRRPDLVLPLVH